MTMHPDDLRQDLSPGAALAQQVRWSRGRVARAERSIAEARDAIAQDEALIASEVERQGQFHAAMTALAYKAPSLDPEIEDVERVTA